MELKSINRIACIGAGLIGSGWATSFLLNGYDVVLYDIKEELLELSKKRIINNLSIFIDKNIITNADAEEMIAHAHYTTDLETAVRDVQFIQESGPENYGIKQNVLKEIEKFTDKSTIIASSTSGLLITEIAKYAEHPERCLGAHPYNPPHLIPLVEMSKGEKTSQEVVDLAYSFYKKIGKEPIVLQKEALGFIANRLQAVLYREIVDLVLKGVCSVEDADKACLFGPGLRYGIMGPNMIFHLGGGEKGIKGMMENLAIPAFALWLPDVAKWEKIPPEWPDIAQKGIVEAMANRDPYSGNTNEEIAKFRDDMLISLLKLHNKL